MDVSSKDFSLNFRGFEHDDPETVQRFTAFCAANFALSPEKVDLLKSSPDTIVLAHGGSLEELEALAKVLREIGAVVDVSPEASVDLASLVGGPSTQELHRLFGEHSESSNDDAPNFCPYPPPLGRSLYLFSRSDSFIDRRALRLRERRERSLEEPVASHSPLRHGPLLVVTCFALLVGVSALLLAALLIRKPENSRQGSLESRTQGIVAPEGNRRDGASLQESQTRAMLGSKVVSGIAVDLKILASPKAVSVSSLSLAPAPRPSPTNLIIKRIEGEPAFLSETSPGEWQGAIILSVSFEEDGKSAHFTMPASIVVTFDSNHETGRAVLTVNSAAPSAPGLSIIRRDTNAFEVSGVPDIELSLS